MTIKIRSPTQKTMQLNNLTLGDDNLNKYER